MILSPFYRLVAILSVASAITTSLLIFLPEPVATDFAARLALHKDPLYLFKKWVLLFHPIFSFLAMTGITAYCIKTKAHYVIPALFFGLIWAFTEAAQQAYTLVALNIHWRPEYLSTLDEASKQIALTHIKSYFAIWDSMYFILILGFGFASLLFGLALLGKDKFTKTLGVVSILIGLFSLLNFISDYLKVTSLLPAVNIWYEWFYSYIQPAWRLALGYWLWQVAKHHQETELQAKVNR